MDFRIGLKGISALKTKARLEKYWSAFAKQSMDRFASRVLKAVEFQFSTIFGPKILSLRSVVRFIVFSVALNCMLAFVIIAAAAPHGQLISYFSKPTLLMIVGILVALNVPLDLVAYVCVRFAIRTAQREFLLVRVVIIIGSIIASYCIAVTSTTLGGVVTLWGLSNWTLDQNNVATLLHAWLKLAVQHPFTSQMSLNGLNVGFIAIGALPSVFILSVTLIFMVFLSTIGPWLHREASVNFGKFLDEKKSFFELMALLFSVVVSVIWGVLSFVSWLL